MSDNSSTPNYLKLGGAKQAKPVDDVETYPISTHEYHIIMDVAKESDFDNFDAMVLSAGISFLLSAIGTACTGSFITEVDNGDTVYIPIWVFLFIQAVLGLSGLIVYFGNKFKKKASKSAFGRLNDRIKNHLGILEDGVIVSSGKVMGIGDTEVIEKIKDELGNKISKD